MSGQEKRCCVEGSFVEPCAGLRQLIDGDRVKLHTLASMQTFEPTRNMVVIRAGEFRKGNGIVMNFCPLCGGNISHHIEAGNE